MTRNDVVEYLKNHKHVGGRGEEYVELMMAHLSVDKLGIEKKR